MRPRLLLLPLVLPVAALSACGLFVDSRDTPGLFTGTDASSPQPDGTYDSKADRTGDSGRKPDGGGAVDASTDRGAVDAAHDSGDGSTDARLDRVAVQDGGEEASIPFCPSRVFPSGEFYLCDDFDENPDARALGSFNMSSGSAITVQRAMVKSPPNALALSVVPVGQGTVDAVFADVAPGNKLTLEMDMLLDLSGGGLSDNYFVGVAFPGSSLFLILENQPDGGAATAQLEEEVQESGNYFIPHNVTAWPSGWAHVQINIATTNGQVTDTWFLNGAQIDGTATDEPFVCNANFSMAGQPTVRIGFAYSSGVPRTAYIDNVVVTSAD